MLRKEFAKICGVTPAYLANYVKRGKVVVSGKDVDISLTENAEFMAARIQGSAPLSKTITVKKVKAKKEDTPQAATPLVLTPQEQEDIEHRRIQSDRKQEALLMKIEAEAKMKNMQAAKLSGEAIPLDITLEVISQLGQSFLTSFRDFCENYAMDMSHKSRWTNQQLADARGFIIEGLNDSMRNAQSVAEDDINKLAETYKMNKTKKL